MQLMRMYTASFLVFLLSGCFPAEIVLEGAQTKAATIMFYPGGNKMDDLLIVDGANHFGKAQYQIDDPLGDIGFRFNSGERVQAECVKVGENIVGDPECKRYEVYRSNFKAIPVGSSADRPEAF